MRVFHITGPAHLASYLVNGDASGITPEERALADAWVKWEGIRILSAEGDSYFGRLPWSHWGGVKGDVIDYAATFREGAQ